MGWLESVCEHHDGLKPPSLAKLTESEEARINQWAQELSMVMRSHAYERC